MTLSRNGNFVSFTGLGGGVGRKAAKSSSSREDKLCTVYCSVSPVLMLLFICSGIMIWTVTLSINDNFVSFTALGGEVGRKAAKSSSSRENKLCTVHCSVSLVLMLLFICSGIIIWTVTLSRNGNCWGVGWEESLQNHILQEMESHGVSPEDLQ